MYSLKDITELVIFIATTFRFKTEAAYDDPYDPNFHGYKFVKTKDLCTEGNYCNERLLGEKHTMCVLPNLTRLRTKLNLRFNVQSVPTSLGCAREIYEKEVNLEMKLFIVHFVNYKRNLVATGLEAQGNPGPQPPASKMPYISWDLELAIEAQRWANQCLIHSSIDRYKFAKNNDVRRYKVFQLVNVIENPQLHPVLSWNLTLNLWYNAVKDFNRNTVDKFSPSNVHKDVVHYTQILWEGTINIGCGYGRYRYRSKNYYVEVLVCNFGPAGNIIGHPVYTVGAPCSECKNSCSFKFPGLCDSPY